MFAVEFSLSPVVVLDLVLQLRLVLQADQVHAQLLQRLQLPVLQLLHGLVVADQHGVLHLFLGLLLVQLLGDMQEERAMMEQQVLLVNLLGSACFKCVIHISLFVCSSFDIMAAHYYTMMECTFPLYGTSKRV